MYKEIRAGVTRLTGGSAAGSALLAYPVGSIFISVNATDPSTTIGGTWVRFGKGSVIVGLDEAQTEFDSARETGGEKTHKLTTQEMPGHFHQANTPDGTIVTDNSGSHDHIIQVTNAVGSSNVAVARGASSPADTAGPIANDGVHSHGLTGHVATTGGDGVHNNLQPYITCYMWERTA